MICIPVDLTNPGQFFACCGLFELADRKLRGREVGAYFEAGSFFVDTGATTLTTKDLLMDFAMASCEAIDPADAASSPLRLEDPFRLRLDWWVKPEKDQPDLGGGGKLKTWAGRQLGPLIFKLMKSAAGEAALAESPLDFAKAIFDSKDGKQKGKTISPFYFDARREGTSLDAGFSADEQGLSVEAYPAVESLALVGLQRFRPWIDDNTRPRSFKYTAWGLSLPVNVAALAAAGLVSVPACGTYRFTRPSRGGEYATMFSHATRERSQHE